MLKNLKKNILSLFKKLGLELSPRNLKKIEDSIKERKRFYTDSVSNYLFLKIKLQEKRKVAKDLKREIEIYKTLASKFPEKSRFFSKLVSNGKYRNLFWMLEKLERGNLAGKMDKDFRFKKFFLKKVSASRLAKIILTYQKIRPKIPLYLHGGWWYWQDFNYHKKTFLDNFIKSAANRNWVSTKDATVAQKILSDNKKFLDQEAKYLSHGDLYPNNLLLGPKGKLVILDWGMINLNNKAFDVAFIYLLANRSPGWQKDFLNCFLKPKVLKTADDKQKFQKLFRLSLISLSLRLAHQCYQGLGPGKKNEISLIFKKNINFLKKAVYEDSICGF